MDAESRVYIAGIYDWVERNFPDLGRHRIAAAAVHRSYGRYGEDSVAVAEHGDRIRRAVADWDRQVAGRGGMMAAPTVREVADDAARRRKPDLSRERTRFGLPLYEALSDPLDEATRRMAVLAAAQRSSHDVTAASRVAFLEGLTVGIAWSGRGSDRDIHTLAGPWRPSHSTGGSSADRGRGRRHAPGQRLRGAAVGARTPNPRHSAWPALLAVSSVHA